MSVRELGLGIRSYHRLVCKLLDLLDGPRCPLLEGNAVEALVHVNGVLASDNVGDGGPGGLDSRLLSLSGRHSVFSVSNQSDLKAVPQNYFAPSRR
jgi:hypothetical protein